MSDPEDGGFDWVTYPCGYKALDLSSQRTLSALSAVLSTMLPNGSPDPLSGQTAAFEAEKKEHLSHAPGACGPHKPVVPFNQPSLR